MTTKILIDWQIALKVYFYSLGNLQHTCIYDMKINKIYSLQNLTF